MSDRILVVDDDPKILSMMRRGLIFAGYDVVTVGTGEEALNQAILEVPGLVVLDVMLPGIDGFEVCRRLRSAEPRLPILLLTARDRVPDRVEGLDAGADDYLVKPFAFDELLARIRALLRRTSVDSQDDALSVDTLRLDTGSREVVRGERPIELTLTEFELLEYLMRHQRQVLTRERIYDVIWGDEMVIGSNVIDVYIKRLREKLEANGESRMIQTVRGVGYTLRQVGD